jgi:hypothetical protein
MTTKQQDEMTRALARAYSAGIDISGQGRQRGGSRFFTIPSASEPGRTHIVVSDGTRLHCDCSAGVHDRICMHRALTHEYLTHEAATKATQAEQVEAALRECALEDEMHSAARTLEATIDAQTAATPKRGQRLGPRLKTDVKAFSIFR